MSEYPHDEKCEDLGDGDYWCGISSMEPGPCRQCLHKYGVVRPMTKTVTQLTVWYLCYTCGHGC